MLTSVQLQILIGCIIKAYTFRMSRKHKKYFKMEQKTQSHLPSRQKFWQTVWSELLKEPLDVRSYEQIIYYL
jgi:hypothetical protein